MSHFSILVRETPRPSSGWGGSTMLKQHPMLQPKKISGPRAVGKVHCELLCDTRKQHAVLVEPKSSIKRCIKSTGSSTLESYRSCPWS